MKTKILFTFLFLAASLFSQTQTTICRNNVNKPIMNLATLRDTIFINNLPGNVCDLNVILDTIFHTWLSDIRIYISHLTTGKRIINNCGGSGDNFIGTRLDDSASNIICIAPPPMTGTFRLRLPDSLSIFNGLVANGAWILTINDTVSGDTGMLKAWCIQLVTSTTGCLTGINLISEIPNGFGLEQNYPNPFNAGTTMRYTLPNDEHVVLKVFNMLGEEIATLVDERQVAGFKQVAFDASRLSSGVYTYRLTAGNYVAVKTMVLMK